MISLRTALVATAWTLLAASVAFAESQGEATLPLGELLELHREREAAMAKPAPVPPPPVSASLVRIELAGALEDDALAVDAQFEVRVLRGHAWSRVRLLETGPSTVVSALPSLDKGALLMDGPFLSFVAKDPGRYVFDLSFIEKAQRNGGRRRIEMKVVPAAVATLELSMDAREHELLHPLLPTTGADSAAPDPPRSEARPLRLFPESGRFNLAWTARRDGADAADAGTGGTGEAPFDAPRIDTVIPRAHASAVATLEGRAVYRVLYELRFTGTEKLAVHVPTDQTLEKLFVNGAPTPFAVDDQSRVEIEVTPEHSGQQEGRVEMVLSSELGRFNLSGQLRFEMPRASWPIHELDLKTSLPAVFNYARLDGSLEPADSTPEVRYSYGIPTPGKALTFHQFLIDGSGPHVNVDYTIDLAGRTYR